MVQKRWKLKPGKFKKCSNLIREAKLQSEIKKALYTFFFGWRSIAKPRLSC